MPKLTQYAATAASVAGEAEALFSIYEQLEPGAKAMISAEVEKAIAEFGVIKSAVTNFQNASLISKVGAGITLLSSVLDIGTVASGIYTDGAKFFGPVWPQVLNHADNIKDLLTGSTAATAPAPATA